MDKLTREAQEHNEIFETLVILEKLMSSVCDKDIEKIKGFFDKHIKEHFDFEEKELFPIILNNGSEEEKALIGKLKDQHKEMLDMLNQLDNFISEQGTKPSEEIMELITEISERLLTHARQEDSEVFPIIKKYEK